MVQRLALTEPKIEEMVAVTFTCVPWERDINKQPIRSVEVTIYAKTEFEASTILYNRMSQFFDQDMNVATRTLKGYKQV